MSFIGSLAVSSHLILKKKKNIANYEDNSKTLQIVVICNPENK